MSKKTNVIEFPTQYAEMRPGSKTDPNEDTTIFFVDFKKRRVTAIREVDSDGDYFEYQTRHQWVKSITKTVA